LLLIPEEAASTFHMIPFALNGSELSLAMEDPSDLEAREFVKRKTGFKLNMSYARRPDLFMHWDNIKRTLKMFLPKLFLEILLKVRKEQVHMM